MHRKKEKKKEIGMVRRGGTALTKGEEGGGDGDGGRGREGKKGEPG